MQRSLLAKQVIVKCKQNHVPDQVFEPTRSHDRGKGRSNLLALFVASNTKLRKVPKQCRNGKALVEAEFFVIRREARTLPSRVSKVFFAHLVEELFLLSD